MTFTPPSDYDIPFHRLRVAIGDTDAADPQLDDEWYIAELVVRSDNEDEVAYRAAMALAGKYAREVANAVGSLKEEAQRKWEHYMGLASALYKQMNGGDPGAGTPSVFVLGSARMGWRSAQSTYPDPFFTRTKP